MTLRQIGRVAAVEPAAVAAAPGPERERILRRWMSTWVVLGLGIVAVTAVFLVLISNSLVGINANLTAADRAVTSVAGNTRTLPDQVAAVNAALAKIDAALADIPGDSREISGYLTDIIASLRSIDGSLQDSAPKLANTSGNLIATTGLIDPAASRLRDTSALLEKILASMGTIDGSLVALNGTASTGLRAVDGHVDAINEILRGTAGDLGNILGVLGGVNGHLANICRNPAVNALHGVQTC